MKRIAAFLSAVMLMVITFGVSVMADGEEISVTLIIEGVSKNLCNRTYTTTNTNLADFLREVDLREDSLSFTIEDSGYGPYLTKVNDDEAGSHGAWSGWMFLVNGVSSPAGIGSTVLSDNDTVILYFSDQYGVGFQFPEFDFSGIAEGKVKVTSSDADYNNVVTVNPVKGAKVKWYVTESDVREYTTDDNGEFTVEEDALTAGSHKVTISKYDEAGTPLVLRTEASVNVDVSTGDAGTAGIWIIAIAASAAVFAAVRKRTVNV